MPKKTRLDEDATIYQPRQEQSEKEKLKDMSWEKRISYIWEYYKLHGLLIILGIAFISYTIYTFTKPKIDTKLYAAIINNPINTDVWDEYESKMTEYLKLDTKTENVYFNYNFYYNGPADLAVNMRQVFAAQLVTADIDLVIAPLSEFATNVEVGIFDPLSDQLPTDLYSSLTDKFYLSGTEENPKVAAYGIYLKDTKLFKEYSQTSDDDPFLIGIVRNSTNKDNAVKFIRYIFNEK
ncbi:hypothetical protein [Herbinix luporum]|uniref:Extracellular solute-binding protein n=1 Tax=Herbinix luporum TaxID=1679721 RepID=A0A0K8J8N8_9FIRM|nr:hypothetical protein [Herbinix luporum]MDI9487807.1 hypothetical protein [Bacillota bacterium]CUH93643.1 hypothetical protein SD1D_2108 [Herbinix luporum]HHT56910.1 hypothetical protein [Herbinix luporum]